MVATSENQQRMCDNPTLIAQIEDLLREHRVPGVCIGVIDPLTVKEDISATDTIPPVYSLCVGVSARGIEEGAKDTLMSADTWMQHASLSKTIAGAFSIEYFTARGISMDTPVNVLFDRLIADGDTNGYRLRSAEGLPAEWAESVTLAQLLNHTALGMHYVHGIPPSREGGMPPIQDLLTGVHQNDYGYADMPVEREPGIEFKYSGGGFLVLQHLLEKREKKPIEDILRPFLNSCGMPESCYTFDQETLKGNTCATGYLEDGREVQDTRLMFPPLAAGGHGTPAAMATFLYHLGKAYKSGPGERSGGISHETAQMMINAGLPNSDGIGEATRKQCFEFMRSSMGLGVFVLSAGPNTFLLHQAANDGFRGLYLVCVDGPDAEKGPRGVVILANGNNNAMFMNCGITKVVLKEMAFAGINWELVDGKEFSAAGISQEQIINLGFKELVLAAFE